MMIYGYMTIYGILSSYGILYDIVMSNKRYWPYLYMTYGWPHWPILRYGTSQWTSVTSPVWWRRRQK